jgi:putative flippase GtrA
MIEKIKSVFAKHRELILYVIFGGLTTAVDWCISFLLYSLDVNVHVADVIAWCAAVLFAFVTNRILVFQSGERRAMGVLRELSTFAGGRVLTLLLQELVVFVFYDLIGWSAYLVKLVAAVLVIVLNYFISKLLVFRKKK